jgi:hypothetical protein
MGQDLPPSSILATFQTNDQALEYPLLGVLDRLMTDPLLVCLVTLALGVLVLVWHQHRRFVFPTMAFVVAAAPRWARPHRR